MKNTCYECKKIFYCLHNCHYGSDTLGSGCLCPKCVEEMPLHFHYPPKLCPRQFKEFTKEEILMATL